MHPQMHWKELGTVIIDQRVGKEYSCFSGYVLAHLRPGNLLKNQSLPQSPVLKTKATYLAKRMDA